MKVKGTILVALLTAGLFIATGCSCTTWANFWGGDPTCECATHWERRKPECPIPGCPIPGCPTPEQVQLAPCAAPGMSTLARAYPVSGIGGKAVCLTKMAPKQVVLDEPFSYQLKVTNLTDQELANVVVTDVKPAHMKLMTSKPEVQLENGKMRWHLGTLGPKASKMIKVNAVAVERGPITSCAEVTYDTPICAKICIVEPKLRLSKRAPAESLKCDRIELVYCITNEGTAPACGITIEDDLPAGMMTAAGGRKVRFSLDSLGPGQSREFKTMVDARKIGRFSSRAMASARSGGKAYSDTATTIVNEPVLAIRESCPSSEYTCRMITYDITVSNEGSGAARYTIVLADIPENTKFRNASPAGVFTHSSPGKVTWNLGTLDPHASRDLSMKLFVEEPGIVVSKIMAKAYCAKAVSDSCRTKLSGIPGILLEVVDLRDPIQVGQTETYVITVTNQGTASDTNIRITCFLEPNMEYVSSKGDTQATVLGNKITFAPLRSLEPKAQAKWHIEVKATGAGNVRFKTIMNSDQLGVRPVTETEATNFYK